MWGVLASGSVGECCTGRRVGLERLEEGVEVEERDRLEPIFVCCRSRAVSCP